MKIYLVGGAVRDKLLGLPVKERDWVVVGATVKDMQALGYRQVGKEFPVFIHPRTFEEYALARMERKVKPGYTGFTFDTSPDVTLEDDLLRRDLTINAMALSDAGDLIDPYGGRQDIKAKQLRHVSSAFIEDPVRILRVGRFLARYASLGFTVHQETMQLMQNMVAIGEVRALQPERVWKELERALTEKNPEKFFEVLFEVNALATLIPHLLIDGEGLAALKTATLITKDPVIRFATLCYDMPEDSFDKTQSKKMIATLSGHLRVPNAYRELAQLTALHYKEALAAKNLSADELLHLFYSLDLFRRKERFSKFLIASEAILKSKLGRDHPDDFNLDWLKECASALDSINVQDLITQGFEGNELAFALKNERKKRIENYIAAHPA